MKMKSILLGLIGILMLSGLPAWAQASEQIALSLQQRTEKGEVVLDILVSNVSTTSIDVVSEGIVPPWSLCQWFKWEVDGRKAEKPENVAMFLKTKESWRIPKGGVILWATIPLRSLEHVIKNEKGQNEWCSVIQDSNRHVITILPNDRWKDTRVRSGRIEVGQQ